MTAPEFDWFEFEDAVCGELRIVARALAYQSDGELPYAFALTAFYAEPGDAIYLPHPALGTVESVAPQSLWKPSAWPRCDQSWARRAPLDAWQERLCAAVEGLGAADWTAAHARYGYALLGAMRRAKAELIADGTLPSGVICLLDDQDGALAAKSASDQELRAYWAARAE